MQNHKCKRTGITHACDYRRADLFKPIKLSHVVELLLSILPNTVQNLEYNVLVLAKVTYHLSGKFGKSSAIRQSKTMQIS